MCQCRKRELLSIASGSRAREEGCVEVGSFSVTRVGEPFFGAGMLDFLVQGLNQR